MPTISVLPFWVTVIEKGTTLELPVGGDNGTPSLFSLLESFTASHNSLDTMFFDFDRGLLTTDVTSHSETWIETIFKGGDCMNRSELINIESRCKTGELSHNDMPIQPFYVQMRARAGATKALLLIQKIGAKSITTIFSKALQNHVTNIAPRYSVKMGFALPASIALKMIEDGNLLQLDFVKYGVPKNVVDIVDTGSPNEPGVISTLSFVARRGRLLRPSAKQPLIAFLKGKGSLNAMFSINFDYDQVKVVVDYNGKERTINVSKPQSMRYMFDITDNVSIVDGVADMHDLRREFNDIANDFL